MSLVIYNGTLYHGTNQAVLDLAERRGGWLGDPEGEVCFTPNIEVARETYAMAFSHPLSFGLAEDFIRGVTKLDAVLSRYNPKIAEDILGEYYPRLPTTREVVDYNLGDGGLALLEALKSTFGVEILDKLKQPIVLAFDGSKLGEVEHIVESFQSEEDRYDTYIKRGAVSLELRIPIPL